MPETQEALKERMARVRAGRKPPASQGVQPSPFAQPRGVRSIGADEEFVALNNGRREGTSEAIPEEGAGLTAGIEGRVSSLTREGPAYVIMYCPTENGWQARKVQSTAIVANLQNGWRSFCPDCNGHHGDRPNDCPGREPVMYTLCPVCQTEIWDNYLVNPVHKLEAELASDPNYMPLLTVTTPAARLTAARDQHMWTRHPQETRAMGINPLPEPSTTVLEQTLFGNPRTNPLPAVQGAQPA